MTWQNIPRQHVLPRHQGFQNSNLEKLLNFSKLKIVFLDFLLTCHFNLENDIFDLENRLDTCSKLWEGSIPNWGEAANRKGSFSNRAGVRPGRWLANAIIPAWP